MASKRVQLTLIVRKEKIHDSVARSPVRCWTLVPTLLSTLIQMTGDMESPGGYEKSNQFLEGHMWGSMRRTALILGSGLFVLGVVLVPGLCFWGFNGLLLLVDKTGKPTFISRYRIQRANNESTPVKLRQSIRTVTFNQSVISFPMLVIYYPVLKWRRDPCCRELPTFHWLLVELALFTPVWEILFYYLHRLFHHPKLFKKIHKKHHEWTAPIGVVSIYADPIEHMVANMLPALVGPLAMGSHLSSITVWLSLVLIISTLNHCGYHLPFLPSPEFHEYHHLKFNECYGILGVLDHLHGTDVTFKQTKAYERHVVLLGFTPLSESIPDPPEKTRSALRPSGLFHQ